MSVPGRISRGAGVSTSNLNQGGVMVSRFRASAKKGNTSCRGRGSHSSVCSANSFLVWLSSESCAANPGSNRDPRDFSLRRISDRGQLHHRQLESNQRRKMGGGFQGTLI